MLLTCKFNAFKHLKYFRPGPPEFTEELHMRQETDGVLLESYLIYEPEHQATWFKEDQPLLGALDFDEKYQVLFSHGYHGSNNKLTSVLKTTY